MEVDGDVVGAIGPGLLALVGIAEGDGEAQLAWMASKLARLRIFAAQEAGGSHFARSLLDTSGALLSVSQFTLLGDARTGTRPSFTRAARPELAEPAWLRFNELLRAQGIDVATGTFGAGMQVALVNDGPVTVVLDR